MQRQWLRIDEQLPENEQDVFYYFGVFDQIYEGKYFSQETNFDDEDGPMYTLNIFGGKCGYLSDDVTYWQPRVEGQECPEMPTPEQKATCRYHPIKL